MKATKRALIAITIILSFTKIAQSQQLANTYWMSYDPLNIFNAYVHLDADTFSFSSDNVTYTPVAFYSENGNTFEIVDIDTSQCSTDTGEYTFTIINDTLRFVVVGDNCFARLDYLTTRYFVSFVTAIKTETPFSQFRIFPNPFDERLNIEGNYQSVELSLFDVTGRRVMHQSLNGSTSLSTAELAKAVYVYEVRNSSGVYRKGRLVKE